MYGLMFPDGCIDFQTSDLGELRKDLRWARSVATFYPEYEGLEPVVRVGTSYADASWERFADAQIEVPDWWWARVIEENE